MKYIALYMWVVTLKDEFFREIKSKLAVLLIKDTYKRKHWV